MKSPELMKIRISTDTDDEFKVVWSAEVTGHIWMGRITMRQHGSHSLDRSSWVKYVARFLQLEVTTYDIKDGTGRIIQTNTYLQDPDSGAYQGEVLDD